MKGDLIGARWVANQIAVERAIEKTGAVRAITFHSRVSSAKEFSADTSRGIRQWLPDFSIFHVNGTQTSSERKQLIRSFRHANKGLITNARCLTEGIDVPAVDMVAFIDPRHSRVDIAQATGRAMRKPSGSDKTTGYVVIPLFLERQKGEALDRALQRSDFDNVADILNAMQEQDEDLVQIIREIQEAKGRGEVFNPRRMTEKVEVLGRSIELSTLRSHIFAEAVDSIGIKWDEWFGLLMRYKEREGHLNVPAAHVEGNFKLGFWVNAQRNSKYTMPAARRQRLDAVGFVWNVLDTKWEEGFAVLTRFKGREGHCDVPKGHIEGTFKLGMWVEVRRRYRDTMSSERRKRLDNIGVSWEPRESAWEEGFAALTKFKEHEGHCLVHNRHIEGTFKLGTWVINWRRKRDVMSTERKQQLDAIGFVWDSRQNRWEKGFSALTTFKEREGHCNVPGGHVEGTFKLGLWVGAQRQKNDGMPAERKQRLDDIGLVWDALESAWEEGFAALTKFKEHEGHCLVHNRHIEGGVKLGQWVTVQRVRKDVMSTERRKQLDAVGFVWHSRESAWEEGFTALTRFKEHEGHCLVPQRFKEGTFSLGNWVSTQRLNKDHLSVERKKQLDAIGFVWEPYKSAWEQGFAALTAFKKREGQCNVPVAHVEANFKLGTWVNEQRTSRDSMPAERRQRLDALGFVWYAHQNRWEEWFAALMTFKVREGHCNVPGAHVEGTLNLGGWVERQRYNKNTMSAERRKRLDKLGFAWK